MSQKVLAVIASVIASSTASAEHAVLLALGLTGLAVGWLGARKRPGD